MLGVRPGFKSGGDPDLGMGGLSHSEGKSRGKQQEECGSVEEWPYDPPQFTQRLSHGCGPFVGWLRIAAEMRLAAIVPRLAACSVTKNRHFGNLGGGNERGLDGLHISGNVILLFQGTKQPIVSGVTFNPIDSGR